MTSLIPVVRSLLDGHTDRREEARLLDLLREAPAAELNAVLTPEGANAILSAVDDRVVGPDHRSALIDLLARQRCAELSVAAQAAVIYALQSGRTSRSMEEAIRDIFLATGAGQTTALKNEVNMRVDAHDLEGLVFAGIDDDAIRSQLLDHFAAEAAHAEVREAKVLSDIDDTCIARIHESRYAKGTLYPGVLAFYQALDNGPSEKPVSTGDLTFVTARPMDAMGLIENHSRAALRQAGIAQMSVLSGSFLNLHTHDAMADKKVANIGHYSQLFPEYDLVFVGDSGQGDVMVGQRMYEVHGDLVKAVFIHDVKNTPEQVRAEHRAGGIYFFDTYVGAGLQARRLGLISRAGLDQIVTETRSGFEKVEWTGDAVRDTMHALLERDIEAAQG